MTLFYPDTSAVVRAYLPDEDDHETVRDMLLYGDIPVVTSELTRLEFCSALAAAKRGARLADPDVIMRRFDADCSDGGLLTLLRFEASTLFPYAERLLTEHSLRTLDALHLACALTDATSLAAGEPVVLVTRDKRQAEAARANGLVVR